MADRVVALFCEGGSASYKLATAVQLGMLSKCVASCVAMIGLRGRRQSNDGLVCLVEEIVEEIGAKTRSSTPVGTEDMVSRLR